jgi:tellurite resistance protein
LTQAAASYARKPTGAESTIPTGFDPRAASLFEAVVEAAFLVASADGVIDDTERQTFEQVVHEACQNAVQKNDISALVSDLLDQLEEDGVDQRVQMIGGGVHTDEHRREVLRISALMAHISGGVDLSERMVLEKLATGFGLGPQAVDLAIETATRALDV